VTTKATISCSAWLVATTLCNSGKRRTTSLQPGGRVWTVVGDLAVGHFAGFRAARSARRAGIIGAVLLIAVVLVVAVWRDLRRIVQLPQPEL
jgi:hypothetical protein